MDSRASGKNAVRLVLVLWGGLYLAVNPFRALNNGDLYWQRWLGDYILQWHRLPTALGTETFTAAGAPWVPQEWFISIFVALAMRHGLLVPFAILMAVIPIGILASIYVRSTKAATPEAIAIVLMFTGCALAASFGIRAQVLGWGCFAAFLLCLDRRDAWAYAAAPIVVLWANVHASVMLAPVFLLARVIGEVATSGVSSLHKSRDLRILALIAASLVVHAAELAFAGLCSDAFHEPNPTFHSRVATRCFERHNLCVWSFLSSIARCCRGFARMLAGQKAKPAAGFALCGGALGEQKRSALRDRCSAVGGSQP